MRAAADDVVAAESLFREAADAGSVAALDGMALLREKLGDHDGAEHYAQRAADAGMTHALFRLAEKRKEAGDRRRAEELFRRAARVDRVRTMALQEIALLREETGDRDGAERAARRAAEAGSTEALAELADMREEAADSCSSGCARKPATTRRQTASPNRPPTEATPKRGSCWADYGRSGSAVAARRSLTDHLMKVRSQGLLASAELLPATMR